MRNNQNLKILKIVYLKYIRKLSEQKYIIEEELRQKKGLEG